jgi:hypothetical protein
MPPQQFRAPLKRSTKAALSPRMARPPRRPIVGAIRPARREPDRRTTIAKVLALWPHEIEDESVSGRERILAKLRQALRAERRRGLSGHWTYDLARHVELLRVYREELAAVAGRPNDNVTREYAPALRAGGRESRVVKASNRSG